jgi:DNA mismatch repair protein MutS
MTDKPNSKLTPMMKQYFEIKEKYPNTILLFRLGDFYETFYDDAVTISKELEITLTRRDKKNNIPLAGVPYHALDTYLSRLIKKGFSVTICEQTENPKLAKGLVKREVVRTITPGTVLSENLLDEKSNNFVLSISESHGILGISYCDLSTAEFYSTQFPFNIEKLESELTRISPSEVLLPDYITEKRMIKNILNRNSLKIARFPNNDFPDEESSVNECLAHFGVDSLKGKNASKIASGILISFLRATQLSSLKFLKEIIFFEEDEYMILDAATYKNLELTKSFSNDPRATVFNVIDKTVTSMGGRLLKKWLGFPLLKKDKILWRQSIVKEFFEHPGLISEVQELLREVADLERICSRLEMTIATVRDLLLLKRSIAIIPKLKKMMMIPNSQALCSGLIELVDICEIIDNAIYEDVGVTARKNLIKPGYSKELDEYKEIVANSKRWIASLELRERENTGIKNLRVKFNKVFGYYIEVTKVNLDKVPDGYIRKQTIANGERFYTQELKEKEAIILGSEEQIKELENKLFNEIIEIVSKKISEIRKNAAIISLLDSLVSLAKIAYEYNYCEPNINDENRLEIIGGRHPVVERMLPDTIFTPNDTTLDNDENKMIILTGPNMAGKSTYIRQVALIALLAQIGSFVPADSANLCVCDRIFTRVGASDNLAKGESTFMVEMKETAHILRNATRNSLIILDEIGRGTSTYDGLSIAWAVVEYLHSGIHLGAKTLFATHYHELTTLSEELTGVINYSMAVAEDKDEIIFLHRVIKGEANRSYGIEVAKLAGIPKEVIDRASEILKTLENNNDKSNNVPTIKNEEIEIISQMDLFGRPVKREIQDKSLLKITDELSKINPDRITPLKAIELVYRWKNILRRNK